MDRRLEVKAAECFQRQRYAEAAQVYTQCLEKAEDKICRINLLLNRASCYLKEAKFDEAQSDCDEVLTHDEENEKALWKKVKVLCFRGQFQEAHDLATDWIGRDPENQIAQRELRRLEIVMSALKDQEVEFEGSETVHILTDPVITEVRPTPEGREAAPQSSPTSNPSIAIPSLIMLAKNAATPEDEVQQKPSDGILENQEKQETQNSSPDHDNTDKKSNSGVWKHRPPPRGLTSEEYTMCVRFQETGRCMFGDKCTLAHSELELAEWRERFDCRRQRLQEERDNCERGSSGIEQLQERLLGTENPEEVIVESLEAVKVNCNNMLKVDMSSKKCSHSWLFTLTSRLCLRRVMLLDDTYRSYFHISSISKGPKKSQKHQTIDNKCQEWFALDDTDPQAGDSVYRLKIVFKADIYGTFRQTVVLDYGTLPMLAQTVQVDSAPPEEGSQFTQELVSTSGNRWDTNSINLVSFEPRHQRSLPMEEKLKTMYSCPHPEKFSLSRALFEPLSKENYRRRMHELLFIEEMEQYGSIARYNLRATLQLVNRFLLIPGTLSTAKYAHNGELFARMKIESDLSEDSMHGRLILQNCQTAWVMADKKGGNSDPKPTAYEAIIEDKGKNFIFLRMSSDCVTGLQLTCDQEFKAQVQFQLNRLPLCEMHYGVDKLPSVGYVFPDLSSSPDIPWTPDRQWTNMECKLNAKQKEAVIGITSPLSVRLPPILLCGPYGTGKTYTLAQATKHVLKDADTHVLICTHSNSAADLYIKDFLHPYVCAGHDEATPLRIYYRHRWRQTVPETVLPYCLMAEPGSGENFRMPTLSDLETHRVVVTTLSMCRYLCDSEIKPGFFTHIFLDEAAQAMECESLLPLSLAGETTRIVLAGDHMQLSPEVCSEFVKQRDLHRSLLERLHDVYPADFPCKILLCENYRSHEAIIGLTSELFYDSKLVASGKQPAHGQFYPLTFFTAKGEEVQHVNSTGFYNMAEIYELVDRVEELQKTWPASWGELNESSIGIVAPYSDQVVRIRSELRKRKMFRVSVERVLNVQGKQFRAILLSTVRTRLTCNTDVAMEDLLDFGFLSNVKLVNMAITRAQSLVAVVGDPMSLCAVGKCRKVWEHFVKLCSTNNSLHGTTWEQVRLQLDGLEMKRTYVLNPNAIEFVPNRLRHGVPLTARDVFEPYPFNPRPHHPDYLHSYYPQVMFPYPTMPHYGPAFPIYPPALMMQQRFHRSPHGAHRSGKSHRLSPVQRGYKTASPPAQRRGSPSDGVRHPPEGEATGASRTPPPMNRKTANRYPRGHLSNGAVPIHHPGAMPFFTQMPYGMFVPEDPRMYMYHGGGYPGHFPGFLPMGPIPYPIPRYLPPFQSGPYHGPMYHGGPVEERHGSPNSNRSTPASQYSGPPSRPASGDQRAYSPASSPNSFQQVQLLPNVKHAPAHLVGQEDSGQPANMATDLNPQGKTAPPRSRPNRPVKEREKRRLANGPGPHSQRDRTNKPDLSLEATLNTSQPALPRQLSEELQTPTQIHDLMKMIDESTLESPKKQLHNHPLGKAFISPSKVSQGSPGSSCGPPFSPPLPLTTNDHSSAQGKELRLNISLANTRPAEKPSPRSGAGGPMVSPPSTLALPEKNEKPTYAGVLRRPPPSPQPQTPVTPAVFPTSPRDQMGNDAMDILRNLNFKASPGTQALYQYFS